jgi:hypothetical protein
VNVFFHEILHLLAFHTTGMTRFRKLGTDEPRITVVPGKTTKYYTCEIDATTGTPQVTWDVNPTPGTVVYAHHFLPGILEAIDARGLKAADCSCPLDPKRTYTNEDIENCLEHPNHCAVAIVTEKVAEETRKYFQCPSAKGMEIENGNNRRSCHLWFTGSHWKTRVLKGEIMNYQTFTRFEFVSRITLALLEDSGWYKVVDYSLFDPPVPGMTWGHMKGCSFLLDSCVRSKQSVLDPDGFCTWQDPNAVKCSTDALTILSCTGAADIRTKPASYPKLAQYQYLADEGIFFDNWAHFDHCPVFHDASISSCIDSKSELAGVKGAHSRCFMNLISRNPSCLPAKCSSDRKSYTIQIASGKKKSCTSAGENVDGMVCQDPKIICSDLNGFHSLPGTIVIPNADI